MDRLKTTAIHLSRFLICILVSGCAHTVAVSYLAKSQIDPDFTKPEMLWDGEPVQVQWASSLQAESAKYLTKCDQILLADSIHEKGLRHEYKVAGKGTPLVIYNQNPEITPEEKHYPHSGIVLGLTAVKEDRPGRRHTESYGMGDVELVMEQGTGAVEARLGRDDAVAQRLGEPRGAGEDLLQRAVHVVAAGRLGASGFVGAAPSLRLG